MLQNRTFHFAATKELGCSVGRQFRLLDFTAQTTLASSYGLLRISYLTAIGVVEHTGDFPECWRLSEWAADLWQRLDLPIAKGAP